jgi:predicted DCC family thiol-disulfide oxidoreductase YuxK
MTTQNGPVLIYDGACEFCRRWIARLRLLTADRVEYLSSQEAVEQFPDILSEKFQASVQLVQPDGSVYEGADAVFRTLAYNPNHSWPLWMYQKVPGVAPITEFLYRLVARNRNACGLRPKGS